MHATLVFQMKIQMYIRCDDAAMIVNYGKNAKKGYDFIKDGGIAGTYMYYQVYTKRFPNGYIKVQ